MLQRCTRPRPCYPIPPYTERTHMSHTIIRNDLHQITTYNGTSVYWDPTAKQRNHFIEYLPRWRDRELCVRVETRDGEEKFLEFIPTSGKLAHNGVISGLVEDGGNEYETHYVGKSELFEEVMGDSGWTHRKVHGNEWRKL